MNDPLKYFILNLNKIIILSLYSRNELIEAEKQKKDPKCVVLPKVATPVMQLKSPNPAPASNSMTAQPAKPVTPQPQQK